MLANSPHLEQLKEKGYEVLLMTDPVDEWVVRSLSEYSGKKLKSAETGTLETDDEQRKDKDDFKPFLEFVKKNLDDSVKDVRVSTRLKDSISCLSGDDTDISAYMEKILKATGQAPPDVKRILELNTSHPVIQQMKSLFENNPDDPVLPDYSHILLDMAIISEGGKIEDPAAFSKSVTELMSKAM